MKKSFEYLNWNLLFHVSNVPYKYTTQILEVLFWEGSSHEYFWCLGPINEAHCQQTSK